MLLPPRMDCFALLAMTVLPPPNYPPGATQIAKFFLAGLMALRCGLPIYS
jgi:hypothetical protein